LRSSFTASIHLFRWRPRLRCPCTSAFMMHLIQVPSSLLCTCLYHHSLASRALSVMLATPTAL
jgi:hypothetical protein